MALGIKYVTVFFSFVILYLQHIQVDSRGHDSTYENIHRHWTISSKPQQLSQRTSSKPHQLPQPRSQRTKNSYATAFRPISIAANPSDPERNIIHNVVSTDKVHKRHQALAPESLQTQSQHKMLSKWVSVAGCGYWSLNNHDTLSDTIENFKKYFKDNYTQEDDRFKCSLKCSSKPGSIYFVFHKTLCTCISGGDLLLTNDSLSCLTMCNTIEHYCYSGDGVPVFVFKNPTKDIQIPMNLLRNFHQQCLKQENGVYKSVEKRICHESISKDECTNLNVVSSPGGQDSNLFVQWICEKTNRGTYTKFFRTIIKPIGHISTAGEFLTTASTKEVAENFDDNQVAVDLITKKVTYNGRSVIGNSSNPRGHSTASSNTIETETNGIWIFNGVVLAIIVVIFVVYCVLRSRRIQNSSQTKQLELPNDNAIPVPISTHYETTAAETASVRSGFTVQISNQAYNMTDN